MSRGLILGQDTRLQKAHSLLEALNYGVDRTGDFIKQIFMTLSSLVRGGSSVKQLGWRPGWPGPHGENDGMVRRRRAGGLP